MTCLAIGVIAAALGSDRPEGGGPSATSYRAATAILSQQTADGAITMSKVGAGESSVVPYYGCFAAQGLVEVYGASHRSALLDAARRWADWYAAHQNPDGTIFDFKGRSNAWRSTRDFDSSDSYAAVYLSLLWEMQRAAPDASWLKARGGSVKRAVAGIRLTMQPCGMTIAKPNYPVMYTMDNVETLLGLRAATRLAEVCGDGPLARETWAEADKMEKAISTMEWDSVRSSYRIAVQVDGGKMEGLSQWYPDLMANLMAIAWLPGSDRNRALFGRLYQKFGSEIPARIKSENDLERLVWWGWAAKGAGDRVLLAEIRHRLAGFEAVCANGCDAGLLGHVARLTG